MQKKARSRERLTATLFFVVYLLAFPLAAMAVQVVSAPLNQQAAAENGMVRVYLSSLGNPSTLSLTTEGSYRISGGAGQELPSGARLTVQFSSATGALSYTYNGVKTSMGTSFTLRRNNVSGSGGIRIAQGRVPGNLYPGDISFRAVNNGGSYKLYTVAHIYLENYLYGVLPYEMGNSAPMEALKAQAVAARTYTVRMMQNRASGEYDVVDTTSDQQYSGTPSGNENCKAAVDGTKGIVVKNGFSYTATYYSASNGGQTESILNAWGTAGYGYLGVKDDPFDLQNPDSTVRRFTVYASAGSNASGLLSLLKNKAVSALKNSGYAATFDNTTLQTIQSISPRVPKYAAPSRLYTQLDFVMTASTRSQSGSMSTATVTVSCHIFSELESLLSMGIQSASNELWSVARSGNDFVLEARRYGHGVGMSQRGAMHMGRQGYTYDQILGFYFPGCQRVRIAFTNQIFGGDPSDGVVVEQPAELSPGGSNISESMLLEGYATVTTASGSLNLRQSASTGSRVLTTIPQGVRVEVIQRGEGWSNVTYNGFWGYVMNQYLAFSDSIETNPADIFPPTGNQGNPYPSEILEMMGSAVVTTPSGTLNLRAIASLTASILRTIPRNFTLTVLERGGEWSRVQYLETEGYVMSRYLTFLKTPPEGGEPMLPPVQPEQGQGKMAQVTTLSGSLNLRQGMSKTSAILAQIPQYFVVQVAAWNDIWSYVRYNGELGYVMTEFLTRIDAPGDRDEALANALQPPDGSPLYTAWVNVERGTLNLREEPSLWGAIRVEIPRLEQVSVLAENGEWCLVRYFGNTGYVMKRYLKKETGSGLLVEVPSVPLPPSVTDSLFPEDSMPPASAPAPGNVPREGHWVRLAPQGERTLVALWPAENEYSTPLADMLAGERVMLEEYGETWCRISYFSTVGYCRTENLSFSEE